MSLRFHFLSLLRLLAAALALALLSAPMPAGVDAAVAAPAATPVPDLTGLVVDPTGRLDDAVKQSLASRLAAIQSSGRAQVAILVSPGSGAEPLPAYALRVAESWQLGRAGRDDGLLVVVVPAPPQARIEVGYGLEGAIPDALAARWLDALVPALAAGDLGGGLERLVDDIDAVLPGGQAAAPKGESNYLFPDHPEWRLPFVLVIFSLFTVMPLVVGRWGALVAAPMLSAFYGLAAWSLWDAPKAGYAAAALAFPWPLLWGLNHFDELRLSPLLRRARALGNGVAILLFFVIVTLFVGVGLDAAGIAELWTAPMFAGLLALGLVPFLFKGRAGELSFVIMRSYVHFAFALLIFWFGVQPFVATPAGPAFLLATSFTACIGASLWLDARAGRKSRASPWLIGAALLLFLPFGALVLFAAAVEDEPASMLARFAGGGGSIGAVMWWAARQGFFATLKIGLGGRFGGGGAGRQ